MDHPHQHCGEEGPTASLLPETSAGPQTSYQDTQELLYLHGGEPCHGKHHQVDGDQLQAGHFSNSLQKWGHQDPERVHLPLPETIFTAAFRQALTLPEFSHREDKEELLSPGHPHPQLTLTLTHIYMDIAVCTLHICMSDFALFYLFILF